MYKKYLFCLPVIYNISANIDYLNIIKDVNYDNYEEKIQQFESIKDDSPEYLYYYGILIKNVLLLNIISDDFDKYFSKLKKLYNDLLSKNIKKYNILTTNEALFLYNYFLARGCEYINIKKYEQAKKSFNIAKEFYETHEINIKLAFINQLIGNIDEAVTIYNNEKQLIENEINNKRKFTRRHITENKILIETVNLNLLYIFLLKKNYTDLLKFLAVELDKQPYNINYIEILHNLNKNHDIDIAQYLNKNEKIRNFQSAILDFFDKNYKDSYTKLTDFKFKDIEHLKFYSDLLYNYALELQKIINNKDIKEYLKVKDKQTHDKIIKENIDICKEILKFTSNDRSVVNRLCVLYIVNKENKIAEDFIRERNINIKELDMDIFNK